MGQPTDLGNGGKSLVTSWCMCNINWCMIFSPSRYGTIASSWADQWIFLEKGALPFGIPSSAYVILPKNSWVQSPSCKPKVDSDVCSLVTCGFPLRQVQLHRDLEGKWRTSGCPRVNTWCSTAENSRDKRLALQNSRCCFDCSNSRILKWEFRFVFKIRLKNLGGSSQTSLK